MNITQWTWVYEKINFVRQPNLIFLLENFLKVTEYQKGIAFLE